MVSFRDLPECLTSGEDECDAFSEATDALEEAIASRIVDGDPIPVPSISQAGERDIPVPPGMAAKAALVVAHRESGLTLADLAKLLDMHEMSVARLLDPRHTTATNRIDKALKALGSQLVIETRAAWLGRVGRNPLQPSSCLCEYHLDQRLEDVAVLHRASRFSACRRAPRRP